MKKIKTFAIAYLAFLILITACGGDCGPFPDKFNITSFNWDVKNVTFSEEMYNAQEITNNQVNYANYGIVVNAETATYFSKVFNISLLDKAYACSPVDPTTDDKITNIEIVVNQDFNTNFLAGSNMASKFKIGFVSENNMFETMSLVDYIASNPKVSREFVLLLEDAPLENGDFTFTVAISMDGKTLDYFDFTTDSITITNN